MVIDMVSQNAFQAEKIFKCIGSVKFEQFFQVGPLKPEVDNKQRDMRGP